MQLTFDLEYIGESDFEFKNKFELFEFYYQSEGRIMDIFKPFEDEYFNNYKKARITFTEEYYVNMSFNINEDLDDSITRLIEKVKHQREYNIKSCKQFEGFKKVWMGKRI